MIIKFPDTQTRIFDHFGDPDSTIEVGSFCTEISLGLDGEVPQDIAHMRGYDALSSIFSLIKTSHPDLTTFWRIERDGAYNFSLGECVKIMEQLFELVNETKNLKNEDKMSEKECEALGIGYSLIAQMFHLLNKFGLSYEDILINLIPIHRLLIAETEESMQEVNRSVSIT